MSTKVKKQPPKTDLSELASLANAAHAACEQAIRSGITQARDCGDVLLKAKAQLPHGDFVAWVENRDCRFSVRQAQRYMLVANNWNQLLTLDRRDPKTTRASHLQLEAAERP